MKAFYASILFGILTGCIKVRTEQGSTTSASHVMDPAPCAPRDYVFKDLPPNCRLQILMNVPIRDLLKIINNSDPMYDEVLIQQAKEVLPSWLMADLRRQASGKALEKSIKTHYLAYLRTPSMAKSDKSLLVRRTISDFDSNSIFGVIGDHFLAYTNLETKQLKIIDTTTGALVKAFDMPDRDYSLLHRGNESIEMLSNSRFALIMSYRHGDQWKNELTVWDWQDLSARGPVYSNPSFPVDSTGHGPTIFRVSDQEFLTQDVRDTEGHRQYVLSLWDLRTRKVTKTVTMNRRLFYYGKSFDPASIARDASEIAKNGITVDSLSLLSQIKLDDHTAIRKVGRSDVSIVYEPTQKDVPFTHSGREFTAYLTPNADIVLKPAEPYDGVVPTLTYISFWQTVREVAARIREAGTGCH